MQRLVEPERGRGRAQLGGRRGAAWVAPMKAVLHDAANARRQRELRPELSLLEVVEHLAVDGDRGRAGERRGRGHPGGRAAPSVVMTLKVDPGG